MKLVKLKTDHYVVVADSDIKEGDWCEDNGTIYNVKDKKHLLTVLNLGSPVKITHSTQPIEDWIEDGILMGKKSEKIKPLKLSEVKELIGEVDVFEKLEQWFKSKERLVYQHWDKPSFLEGYHQALEDNKEKKYTEEDIRKVILVEMARKYLSDVAAFEIDEIIQSLQPRTEWVVEFIDGKLTLKKL